MPRLLELAAKETLIRGWSAARGNADLPAPWRVVADVLDIERRPFTTMSKFYVDGFDPTVAVDDAADTLSPCPWDEFWVTSVNFMF